MRSSRAVWSGALALVVAGSTMAVAGAFISNTGGGVIQLSPAPPSVALNALENATKIVTFDEAQAVTLTAPVAIDLANPGTYGAFPATALTVPAGAIVDSHLLHSDPPLRKFTIHRTGSVTFADDILGVVVTTPNLAASDATLGAPGTLYAGARDLRGLESKEDKVTISSDRRTLSVDLTTTAVMDDIRVITRHTDHLAVSVTGSPDPVQAGNDIVYTATVTNAGSATVADASLGDVFPGATLVSATAPGGCTGTTAVTCALGSIAPGATVTATFTVTSPSTVPVSGVVVNTATSPPGLNAASATTTVVSAVLDTTIADSPDPVTVGNNVQYSVTVTNHGIAPVADAHAIDTLPPGTTLVTASASGGCTGTTTVDCSLGPLAVNASAVAKVVVASPGAVPDSGTITDSATASPGSNPTANETTTVEASSPGVAKGFVLPGGSITIPGDNPATVTLPDTGDGAPIVITQGDGSFCDGPCDGPATTISDFPGYSDPLHPIRLTLTYTFPDAPDSLTRAATAFGSTIYKNDDPMSPNLGAVVPACTTPGGGVAIPHPCVDAHSIAQPTFNSFVVTFEIVYLSGDPRFARR